jgi:RNA polymerase sigma-70 factor (ECF subfamily)
MGDERAGATLFRRYYPAIARFFRNKAPEAVQDDLIQATFLACVDGRERLRAESGLRSYLFSVAYKQLCTHYRQRHREGTPLDTSEISAAELAPGPSTMIARRQEHRLLAEALRRIPLDHQVVLELCYWEGQTAAQIAELFDIPVGTAKTRIRRARQLLTDELQQLAETKVVLDGDLEGWAAELREAMGESDAR